MLRRCAASLPPAGARRFASRAGATRCRPRPGSCSGVEWPLLSKSVTKVERTNRASLGRTPSAVGIPAPGRRRQTTGGWPRPPPTARPPRRAWGCPAPSAKSHRRGGLRVSPAAAPTRRRASPGRTLQPERAAWGERKHQRSGVDQLFTAIALELALAGAPRVGKLQAHRPAAAGKLFDCAARDECRCIIQGGGCGQAWHGLGCQG